MKLLADESVDQPIVERLRNAGHNVLYVAELAPSISDDEVLRLANDEDAILVTVDNDFGELVFRQHRVHGGVVLIRLFGISSTLKAEIVAQVFQERAAEMPDAFTVIAPGIVRIRHDSYFLRIFWASPCPPAGIFIQLLKTIF
jgi:predicted nuclease of predicted toxin-antitoxin system